MNFDSFADIDENTEEEATLETLKKNADEAVATKKQIDELQSDIDMLSKRYNYLTATVLPNIMGELGMPSFSLDGGFKITIKEVIQGSMDKAPDREFAKQWVLDRDGAELIKTDVTTSFGRGEHNLALDVKASLEERGLDVSLKEGIHPQTFSAFVRGEYSEYLEQLEQGQSPEPIPFTELGLYHGRKAEIKGGKK